MSYVLVVGGLVLLFLGGEALVRGSVGVARRLGVSELVIGLTLVGFGTSIPELVTSLRAINLDAVGISVGNVVGSNVANVLMVLGVAALIRPIKTHPKALARDFSAMVAATALFCVLVYLDFFTRAVGFGLVGLLLVYMGLSVVLDRAGGDVGELHADEAEAIETEDAAWLSGVLTVGGVAGVILGARLLVDGGVELASAFGVSEAVIGLSVVAIGTSLPELATSAVSALRGKSDVALGNILGSNIFNVLGIVGVTAAVHPFSVLERAPADAGSALANAAPYSSVLAWSDIGALALSVLLLLLFAFTGRRLARWEGGVLLFAYALYMATLFR